MLETPDEGEDLVWDIETDGLIPELTKIHCIGAINANTGAEYKYRPHQIEEGLAHLARARRSIGHNLIGFDIPAIQKLYPNWKPGGEVFDTIVLTRLHRPDTGDIDFRLVERGKLPPSLRKSHGLEAWGYRIGGEKKSQFGKTADWSVFTEEMLDYCVQDVRVNVDLWHFLLRQKLDPRAIEIEGRVAQLLDRQERTGVGFDKDSALVLQADLQNQAAIVTARLREVFKPWFAAGKPHVTKSTRHVKMHGLRFVTMPRFSKTTGKQLRDYNGPPFESYTEGTEYVPIKMTEFSPSSRDHIANRLITVFGWRPQKFTDDGRPATDETVLEALPTSIIPAEVKADLIEFTAINKLLGQLGQGAQSWLRNVNRETNRIHGRVITNGAVTGRATHRNPNLAQVPKVMLGPSKEILKGFDGRWGWESRSLFIPRPGWEMVGADCSGLELRCLGHYLAAIDGGAYIEVVTKGDPHTYHQGLASLDTRDTAKTWIYAFIYGAGAWKLGHIASPDATDDEKVKLGRKLIKRFLKNFPALAKLREGVIAALQSRGYLIGLDGRRIFARSAHSALNALLQSAGAVVCKQWLIELDKALTGMGLTYGEDWEQLLWVHDEVQLGCRPGLGEIIGREAEQAAIRAGEVLGLKCPTKGDSKIGSSWALTH
jgi:DNA polymerase-1